MTDIKVRHISGKIEMAFGREVVSLTRAQAIQVMGYLSTALTAQSTANPEKQRTHSLSARAVEVNIVAPGPRVQIQIQLEDFGILGFDLSPELTGELKDFLERALRALPNLPDPNQRH